MELAVGQTVGQYQVLGILGSGGMGTVYKVRHLISERVEAMKLILPQLVGTSETAERFLREIRVQARLSHPNIASLHNALRFENQLLMIMEYVEGTTLHSRLRQGAVAFPEALDIILQILDALAYAHSQGVVHRDIKPSNIMLTVAGVIKLMDFGIARALDENRQLTDIGAAVGSIDYMSPEQVLSGPVTPRSDIYSVGVLLYEMVTGTKPFAGNTSWAMMNAHLHDIPKAPASVNSSVPPILSLAIMKGLEKDPEHRYATAGELGDILRNIRNRMPPALTSPAISEQRVSARYLTFDPRTPVSGPVPSAPSAVKTPTPTPASDLSAERKGFDRPRLEEARRRLAVYVGPIARTIVDRAVKKAANWQELYELLSVQIPDSEDRKRFLKSRTT